MWVEIGNESAIEGYRDPRSDDPEKVRYRSASGERITQMAFPEGASLNDAFQSAVKIVAYHVAEGEKPVWIDSDNATLEQMLKAQFGIKTSRPKEWGRDSGASRAPRMSDLMATLALPAVLAAFMLSLRTNAGRDWQARIMGSGGAGGAGTGAMHPADFIGLTTDATAPNASSTTLTSEIAAGTLTRAQAIFAHTTGTASYTLTWTFTADQPVTIAKLGVFNAVSGGTLVFETMLNAPAPMQSGDQLAITETITL